MITRFAPSPTGLLHLGHIANAVYVWGMARAQNGTVILRLEDHDRGRFRPEYEAAILRDLAWLGLKPDLGSPASFRRGVSPYRQSDRLQDYQRVADELRANGLLYACECSRAEISAQSDAAPGDELAYGGRCRNRELDFTPDRGVRVKMPDSDVEFEDGLLGPQRQNPQRQCGDMLIRDRNGNWTYQFCVTVDDLDQRVTSVIRGRDLLSSTGRQLALRSALGGTQSLQFFHHDLIRDVDGRKLSKRDGDMGVAHLRDAGVSATIVLGRVAHLLGLTSTERELDATDLPQLFAAA